MPLGRLRTGRHCDGEKVAAEDLPLPARLVAISSAINDKFPFADTDEDDFYRYCGVRETSNATWTATLSRRTIENLLNIPLRDHQDSIVELFRYLAFPLTSKSHLEPKGVKSSKSS